MPEVRVSAAKSRSGSYRRGLRAKRLFDLAVSLVLLIGFAPVMLITAVAVRTALGRPVLFRQRRPGLGGKPFELVKFRTMRLGSTSPGEVSTDAQRLTQLGRLLRSTSLDELPQLWNVLRGDMSLVGPRPLLLRYLDRYTAFEMRRHEARPGITGWVQVNGRNALTWKEKFAMDVWYVDNRSFKLDLKILALTLRAVIFRNGIAAEGTVTMPEYKGAIGDGQSKEREE